MTLNIGKKKHTLTKHIDQLCRVTVQTGSYNVSLAQVSLESMAEMYNKDQELKGIPIYVALENGDHIIVSPRPDHKYKCQVLGYVLVVQ